MLLPSLLWPLTPCSFFSYTGWSTAQIITQSPPAVSIQEIGAVTLQCVYTIGAKNYDIYWYKQSPNGEVIYILHQNSLSSDVKYKGRYSLTFHKEAKSVNFTILSSRLKDSGMYFCAGEGNDNFLCQ
uniref:Ig-like domain-containing protein n=1 Tax=Sarcophilus harrisii TaxID=9305 RepID=A0A7N4PF06_SARHA